MLGAITSETVFEKRPSDRTMTDNTKHLPSVPGSQELLQAWYLPLLMFPRVWWVGGRTTALCSYTFSDTEGEKGTAVTSYQAGTQVLTLGLAWCCSLQATRSQPSTPSFLWNNLINPEQCISVWRIIAAILHVVLLSQFPESLQSVRSSEFPLGSWKPSHIFLSLLAFLSLCLLSMLCWKF